MGYLLEGEDRAAGAGAMPANISQACLDIASAATDPMAGTDPRNESEDGPGGHVEPTAELNGTGRHEIA
jgi:hypothetical protein